MALKIKYQVEQIPAGASAQQIEDFLNATGQNGWEVIQFIQVGANMFVIAKKEITV